MPATLTQPVSRTRIFVYKFGASFWVIALAHGNLWLAEQLVQAVPMGAALIDELRRAGNGETSLLINWKIWLLMASVGLAAGPLSGMVTKSTLLAMICTIWITLSAYGLVFNAAFAVLQFIAIMELAPGSLSRLMLELLIANLLPISSIGASLIVPFLLVAGWFQWQRVRVVGA